MSQIQSENEKLQEGYKEAQIGPEKLSIPVDWTVTTVGDVASKFISGGTPDSDDEDYWGGDIPWTTAAVVEGPKFEGEKDFITQEGLKNSSASLVPEGGILFGTRVNVANVGRTTNKIAISQDLTGIVLDESKVDPDFVVWYLLLNQTKIRARYSQGSTIQGMLTDDLKSLPLLSPPLSEQRRIAKILSTVDEEIQQTSEIVEAKQDLTQGLINRLVKTGVQDSPDVHEIQIGPKQVEIPTNWDLLRVDELVTDDDDAIRTGPFGSKLKKEYLVSEGIKVYEQSNVYDSDFSQGNRYVTRDRYESELTSYDANPGDVLITLQGTIGDAAVLPENAEPGVINQKLMRVRVDTGLCLPEYFATFFDESQLADFQIEAVSHGAVVSGLNISTISGIRVPLPPIQEQQKIIDVVESSKSSLAEEQETKRHLQELKRGLMQDLLTGEVRVDTDN